MRKERDHQDRGICGTNAQWKNASGSPGGTVDNEVASPVAEDAEGERYHDTRAAGEAGWYALFIGALPR
jgi:hypothetical protein